MIRLCMCSNLALIIKRKNKKINAHLHDGSKIGSGGGGGEGNSWLDGGGRVEAITLRRSCGSILEMALSLAPET